MRGSREDGRRGSCGPGGARSTRRPRGPRAPEEGDEPAGSQSAAWCERPAVRRADITLANGTHAGNGCTCSESPLTRGELLLVPPGGARLVRGADDEHAKPCAACVTPSGA